MQTLFYQRRVSIRKVFVAQTVSLRPRTHNLTDATTSGNLGSYSKKTVHSSGTVARNGVEGGFQKGTSVVQAYVVLPQGKIKICKATGKSSSPITSGPL
jgi:hypothetical protein